MAARWTTSEDRALGALYRAGEPLTAISDQLGRSQSAVSERRRALGIAMRPRIPPWTAAEDALVRAAHAAGLPASALAQRLGRPVEQVRRRRGRIAGLRAAPRPYTVAEDEQIRAGWERGVDVDVLAGNLLRSPGSVRLRAQKLGLHQPRARPRWHPDEDTVVRDGYEQARSCAQIAAGLSGRSAEAVAARAAKLGVATYARAWSPRDDRGLRALAGEGLAVEAIAQALGRTPQGVLSRARKLDIQLVPRIALRTGQRWTAAEDEVLRLHAALNPAVLAELLHRSAYAVTQRMRRLGLREGRSPHHPASRRGTLTPGERATAARELAAGGPARVLAVARRLDVSPAVVRAAAAQHAATGDALAAGSGRPPL